MSDHAYALTGFGFVAFPESDDEDSLDIDALTEAAENISGIAAELCGDLVIGTIGVFVVLEDTYTSTYYENDDAIKLRDILPSEIATLKQFALDNGLEIADDAIGWRATGYYG